MFKGNHHKCPNRNVWARPQAHRGFIFMPPAPFGPQFCPRAVYVQLDEMVTSQVPNDYYWGKASRWYAETQQYWDPSLLLGLQKTCGYAGADHANCWVPARLIRRPWPRLWTKAAGRKERSWKLGTWVKTNECVSLFCLQAVISVFRWKTFEAAEKSRRTKDDAILPTVFFSLRHSAAVSRVLQFNSAPITFFFIRY